MAMQKGALCEQAMHSSVECIVELLKSLQVLSGGDFDKTVLADQAVETLNARYTNLSDVDYEGPLTYQSMARLPPPYRDAVAVLRQNGGFETSSASDSSDLEQVEVRSNNSGDTEGPEEENQTSGDDMSAVGSSWPYSSSDAVVKTDGDVDRQHARDFYKAITNELMPRLLKLRTSVEVDEAMQEFASGICQVNSLTHSDFDQNLTTLNADGIYLATYSALLLGLQLTRVGHYENMAKSAAAAAIPLTEQQFVTSVQNTGVLVYLSSPWLCELYQSIFTNPLASLSKDLLGNHSALIDMLDDLGGLGPTQMLSDWQRLQSVARMNVDRDERQIAGKKLARRLMTCCWESMVTVLSAGLGNNAEESTNKNRIVALSKKTLRVKRHQRTDGETLYALSLEGLHSAATLSNSLSLQHLSGKILSLISNNVCQTSGSRIPVNQALSMDVLLSGGLELGSYSADCWMPVFSVCRHVTQLEHELFSLQNHQSGNTTLNNVQGGKDDGDNNRNNNSTGAKLNLTIDEDEICVDVYSFLQAPLQNPNTNVTTILKPYSGTHDPILLSQVDTAKILCALSHQADNLFSDAAERLSLPALCQFLKSLCKASREQLYRSPGSKMGKKSWWPPVRAKELNDSYPLSLLLHRVGDVTLKVFRGPRPLLHILKVWAITGPHLMDVSKCKYLCRSISLSCPF